ncbi:MAG: hypothetical protein H7319_15150 [Spirosoma sp.]|nr:hypothetical protein [Spirosoma sp.]
MPSAAQLTVTIRNVGGYVTPVEVIVTFADGTQETMHQTPAIWQVNQQLATVKISTKKKVQSVRLDGGIFVDSDKNNNGWVAK